MSTNNNKINTEGLTFLDDEKGIVEYASDSFLKLANMTAEEIVEEPHNIVRHPDMPRAAFKSLYQV